jgi:SAM-dependent methyltransferase
MTDLEITWDTTLKIKTGGQDDSSADEYRFPYEPTPYCVLERLSASGLFEKNDVVLDYGCGKGRVGFFLSYRTKAKTIGIEYDDRIYESALANQKSAVSRAKPDFVLTRAEEYEVPFDVNRCYFFNPFSVEILRKVMARIIESYYEDPRELFLFFYYPSDEYISYLMTVDELEFYDEIECDDLFEGNDSRERILIFQLPALSP